MCPNQNDGPVSIITFGTDGKIILHEDNLKRILQEPSIQELPIVIFSIAGAFRKGKSFLLNFCIRFLNNKCAENNNCDCWTTAESDTKYENKRFISKSGVEGVTSGIDMWSKPFLVNTSKGQVAVLLMDTQGTFDTRKSPKETNIVFALSTLMSSVQVYNVMHLIQEDYLENLQLFTEYGKLVAHGQDDAVGDNIEKPFGKLIFLVRDFQFLHEYPGLDGANNYLKEVLQIQDGQPPELKSIREQIPACYDDIKCFLMPDPGKKVKSEKYSGSFAGIMDDEFEQSLKEVLPFLLKADNLVEKQCLRTLMKPQEVLNSIKMYVELFNSPEFPTPKSIFEANAENGHMEALRVAEIFFCTSMKEKCLPGKSYIRQDEFDTLLKETENLALVTFRQAKKLSSKHVSEKFEKQLLEYVSEQANNFRMENNQNWKWWIDGLVTVAHGAAGLSTGSLSTILGNIAGPLTIIFRKIPFLSKGMSHALHLSMKGLEFSKKWFDKDSKFVKVFKTIGSLFDIFDSFAPCELCIEIGAEGQESETPRQVEGRDGPAASPPGINTQMVEHLKRLKNIDKDTIRELCNILNKNQVTIMIEINNLLRTEYPDLYNALLPHLTDIYAAFSDSSGQAFRELLTKLPGILSNLDGYRELAPLIAVLPSVYDEVSVELQAALKEIIDKENLEPMIKVLAKILDLVVEKIM